MARSLLALTLSLALAAGCSSETPGAGGAGDAATADGAASDGGPGDTGSRDTLAPTDAAGEDAALDAASPDAARADAAPAFADAAIPDASDAGVFDALPVGQDDSGDDWETISTLVGNPPNYAQLSNGNLMTVVSRAFGRGAEAGALVEAYYPLYADKQLWDSYVGVRRAGELRWAHALTLQGQSIVPDTGWVVSIFDGPGYRLVLDDVVRPSSDVHLRRATVTNLGTVPLDDVALDFYAFLDLGGYPGGDVLRYDGATGAVLGHDDSDRPVAAAILGSAAPVGWQCGYALLPLGDTKDARLAAEGGSLPGNAEAGPAISGVNSTLEHALPPIPPGGHAEITYALAFAGTEADAIALAQAAITDGFEAVRRADAARWAGVLDQATIPQGLPADAIPVFRRAVITLEQHAANNGAFIAAPTNLNPPYRLTWPRDGAHSALELMELGFPERATAFFELLERLQLDSGGWAVNYYPDERGALWNFGDRGNEHDEVGTFAFGVEKVWLHTGDDAWVEARWPAIRRASEFLLSMQEASGLLGTCRDLWELDTDGSWTYSNAAALAGLRAAERIGRFLGESEDSARYAAAADRLEQAIHGALVTPDGYFARGLKSSGLDATVEAANLGLGAACFGVVDDGDPAMVALGDVVADHFLSRWGGVRRHEHDTYYGGRPWPVTTAWLAQHLLARGDRTNARALFDTTTRYAHATDALLLGEQFDEAAGRWLSAFPLAWSEATYLTTARRLFR